MANCYTCYHLKACNDIGDGGFSYLKLDSDCKHYINKADVVEVKHGEWIDTGDEILDTTYSGWKCSECDYIFCGNKLNFCPNCGAKMDGGKAE